MLRLKLYCVKGAWTPDAGRPLGQGSPWGIVEEVHAIGHNRYLPVVPVEFDPGQSPNRNWRNHPQSCMGRRDFRWLADKGPAVRADQLFTKALDHDLAPLAALSVDSPEQLYGPHLAAMWRAGHPLLVFHKKGDASMFRSPIWEYRKDIVVMEDRGGKQVAVKKSIVKWTGLEGRWRTLLSGGKVSLSIFEEQLFTPRRLMRRRCGFGRFYFPKPEDFQRCKQHGWRPPADCIQREDGNEFVDIAEWPLACLPPRRIDWLVGQPWLHGPTLQAMLALLAQDAIAEEVAHKFPLRAYNPPGMADFADREVFHVTAHYLPGTDELVMDGCSEYSPRPAGAGIPVWLPGGWRLRKQNAGQDFTQEDPCPASLERKANWLFDHADKEGRIEHEDEERWDRGREGIDYKVLRDEESGPTWKPRWYQDRDGNPLAINAVQDGLIILGWLTKLADDAESAWLLDRRGRKSRHMQVRETLCEWRPRVTPALRTALSAGGETGSWVLAELKAQRDRCLAALTRKKRPSALVQDRADELLTDLLFSWSQVRELVLGVWRAWASNAQLCSDIPTPDGEGLKALAVRQWHDAVALRVGLLFQDRRGRRILRKALREAGTSLPVEGLVEAGKAALSSYRRGEIQKFYSLLVDCIDDAFPPLG